jgi:hypothetical protein
MHIRHLIYSSGEVKYFNYIEIFLTNKNALLKASYQLEMQHPIDCIREFVTIPFT